MLSTRRRARSAAAKLRTRVGDGTFSGVKKAKGQRSAMEVGDRVLVKGDMRRQVMLVARVDIPHSTQKVFVTRSGGDFTVGVKIWKSDYTWSEKSQMWVSKR